MNVIAIKTKKRNLRRSGVMLLIAPFMLCSLPAYAADSIYWGNEGSRIKQGGLVSGSPQDSFIGTPCGIAIDPAAGNIYWTNFDGNNDIRRAALSDPPSSVGTVVIPSQPRLCGVAINPLAKKIYWTNFNTGSIWSANLDGSKPRLLFSDGPNAGATGVAINPAANKIYWTTQFSNQVRVANLDGTGTASTLISETHPLGVALDPVAGKIYWAQFGGTIRAASLTSDGLSLNGAPLTLFSGENTPAGVAIDPAANKIYWASFSGGEIRVGNLDGSAAALTLFVGQSLPNFPALLKKPASISLPNISGGAKTGKQLTCEKGGWAPDLVGGFLYQAPQSFTFEWQKDNIAIGVTSQKFTPTTAGSYTCTVTATNFAGATLQTSEPKKVKEK